MPQGAIPMKIVLEYLQELIEDSYSAAGFDRSGLDTRIFDTCVLFYYKMKIYSISNTDDVTKLYNNLRLSTFVNASVNIIDPSYPLIWLTEINQKLVMYLSDTPNYRDTDYSYILNELAINLSKLNLLHVTPEPIVEDPVYRASLTADEWVHLYKQNPWLITASLIKLLPVSLFNNMLNVSQEEEDTDGVILNA